MIKHTCSLCFVQCCLSLNCVCCSFWCLGLASEKNALGLYYWGELNTTKWPFKWSGKKKEKRTGIASDHVHYNRQCVCGSRREHYQTCSFLEVRTTRSYITIDYKCRQPSLTQGIYWSARVGSGGLSSESVVAWVSVPGDLKKSLDAIIVVWWILSRHMLNKEQVKRESS